MAKSDKLLNLNICAVKILSMGALSVNHKTCQIRKFSFSLFTKQFLKIMTN